LTDWQDVAYYRSMAAETELKTGQIRDLSSPGAILGFRVADVTDLIPKIEQGFPYATFANFVSASGMLISEATRLLGIPERTLARRKESKRLTPAESERLWRLSNLVELAFQLFEGDRDAARRWLSTPKKALRHQSPLQFARTEIGAREVEKLIGRMEQGVFS